MAAPVRKADSLLLLKESETDNLKFARKLRVAGLKNSNMVAEEITKSKSDISYKKENCIFDRFLNLPEAARKPDAKPQTEVFKGLQLTVTINKNERVTLTVITILVLTFAGLIAKFRWVQTEPSEAMVNAFDGDTVALSENKVHSSII